MAKRTDHSKSKKGTLVRTSLKILGILILVLIGMAFMAQRMSDGPTGPIPGGELVTGALVTEPVTDWSFAEGQDVQVQLVDPMGSRTAGIMVHEGIAYVPCDLGFIWARMSGQARLILHTIYIFKRWHKDAARDGRAVLRIDGTRYEAQLVRVTDPQLLTALRSQIESLAREWIAPKPLGDAPTEGPRDIWFFRVDPRAVQLTRASSVSEGLFPRPM